MSYPCTICGKPYKRRVWANRHMRKHGMRDMYDENGQVDKSITNLKEYMK